jgi:tetratricopeptide (TPR) repeat protein
MDEVYEILIHKVYDYEGTVNEMTGDGIVALFGAPVALEDAPQRAIRSSMAIHREMARFTDKIKKENIPELKMRIGIHTGFVVVGTLGNDLRVEFKAVGDTVNLASRMEGLAEPGSTYVTEDTFKLTEGFFRFEVLGQKEIKGKKDPVNVYLVIASSTRRTRFDVSAERGLTPFVGRDKELELLLDGFDRAKQGRGQAFSIIAEAGVGKSRLLYEFRKTIVNEDVTILEGKCLSYSRGVAYHPVIDLYKSNFNIRESDDDHKIIEKVKKGLKLLNMEEASILHYLLELLSVKDSGIDQIQMTPEGRKSQMIEMMMKIPLKGSEIRPLILVIEDLHWMDKSSEEVLKQLLESIAGARILLLFTYRPEFVHTWGQKSYHSQVNLNRLSNRETLTMASHILGTEDIDQDLEELILEKTEGVPFFIEELIKSLKDLNAIEKKGDRYGLVKNIEDVTIPSTIQDMITARVDTLPEEAKELLQIGSVIEREFSHELIKEVSSLSEKQLLANLSFLKDSEIVFERGIYPESTYVFKHALTQEVVYDSILSTKKKKLHERVGNAIERLRKDKIEEHYGALVEHFVNSENYEKGAEYLKFAGKKAVKAASFVDAVAYYKRRIFCLESLPQTDEVQKIIIDSRVRLGLYYTQLNYHVDSKEIIDPIIDIAVERDYKRELSQIYTILGTYYGHVEEDFSRAFQYLEEAVNIAEEIQDIVCQALANYWRGVCSAYNCEFEKAYYHIKKVLDINVATNTKWGIVSQNSNICLNAYHNTGRIRESYQISKEAVKMAEEIGDVYAKAMAYTAHVCSCLCKGFFEEALQYHLKGIDSAEKSGLFLWNGFIHEFMGQIYFELGEYQSSINFFEKANKLVGSKRGWPSYVNFCKTQTLRAQIMNGEKQIHLKTLYSYIDKNKMKIYEGRLQRLVSEILLNIDDGHVKEAEDCVKKAIETNKEDGMRFHLGRDYAQYAEVLKRKGEVSKAKENLNKAIEIMKECGANGWEEKYEKELAEF